MNQELISTTSQKYMYKACIETVLNNSASTKTYQLEMQGFCGDQGDKDSDFRQTFNNGMTRRYMKFKDDKKVQLMGFLHSDIMGIQGSRVNGIEININLLPNQDNIRVQAFGSDAFGKLVVDDVVLYICKWQMSKDMVVAHADVMKDTPAFNPFKRTEIKTYNGIKGQTEIVIENPYQTAVPTRYIVGMVSADAYSGNKTKNPLKFQHYDISRAGFYIDDESIAKPPYKLDPANGKLIKPFMELYSILGKVGEDKDIGISLAYYQDGLFLLPFDVTPTSSTNMEYLAKKEGGNCRLELHFRKPLPENKTIITYAIFPKGLNNLQLRHALSTSDIT